MHLSHVKTPDPADFIMPVDDCGGLALDFGQHNVCEVLGGGHHCNLLEVVVRHDDDYHFCNEDNGMNESRKG